MRYPSVVLALGTLAVAACSGTGMGPRDLRKEIASHRATWEATRPASYAYTLERRCFCAEQARGPVRVEVDGDSVISRAYVESGDTVRSEEAPLFPDVDGLFRVLDEALDAGADSVSVTWGDGGVPAEISIDYARNVADEEVGFVVREPPVPSG